jgi:hypothetical protein
LVSAAHRRGKLHVTGNLDVSDAVYADDVRAATLNGPLRQCDAMLYDT